MPGVIASKKSKVLTSVAKAAALTVKAKVFKPKHSSAMLNQSLVFRKGLREHDQLDKAFEAIGKTLAQKATAGDRGLGVPRPSGLRPHILRDVVLESRSSRLVPNKDKFGGRWRKALDHHDEIVSTSSVYAMVRGIVDYDLNVKTIGAAELDHLDALFDDMSSLRIPTHEVGFATPAEQGNHLTNDSIAVFADSHSSASASWHNLADLKRRNNLANAMEKATKKSANEIVRSGGAQAGQTSLAIMHWPATSGAGRPYTMEGNPTGSPFTKTEKIQLTRREDLKKTLHTYFLAPQEPTVFPLDPERTKTPVAFTSVAPPMTPPRL